MRLLCHRKNSRKVRYLIVHCAAQIGTQSEGWQYSDMHTALYEPPFKLREDWPASVNVGGNFTYCPATQQEPEIACPRIRAFAQLSGLEFFILLFPPHDLHVFPQFLSASSRSILPLLPSSPALQHHTAITPPEPRQLYLPACGRLASALP